MPFPTEKLQALMMTTAKPELPPFEPRFTNETAMGLYYEDGRVIGAVDTYDLDEGGKQIVISEWAVSGEYRDQGCSTAALKWLREQGFTSIVANGVGMLDEQPDGTWVGDIATNYWVHMHTKGLVDVLLDDEHNTITVDAQGNASYAPEEASKAGLRP